MARRQLRGLARQLQDVRIRAFQEPEEDSIEARLGRAFNDRDLVQFSDLLQTLVRDGTGSSYGKSRQRIIHELAETVALTGAVEYAAPLLESFVQARPLAEKVYVDVHHFDEVFEMLSSTMSQDAVAAMSYILAPRFQTPDDHELHSINQVLVDVYTSPGLAAVAVQGGIPAVNNFLEASRANVPAGRNPAEDRRHRGHLAEALLAAIQHQTEAERYYRPEAARQNAAIVDLLLSQGARVFDDPLSLSRVEAPSATAALGSTLSFASDATRNAFGRELLPVGRRVFEAARESDADRTREFLAARVRSIEEQMLAARSDAAREAFDAPYANLIYEGAPLGISPAITGRYVHQALSRPWLRPEDPRRGPGLEGAGERATRMIVTVLLCAKRRGLWLPVELWLNIFERLLLIDMVHF